MIEKGITAETKDGKRYFVNTNVQSDVETLMAHLYVGVHDYHLEYGALLDEAAVHDILAALVAARTYAEGAIKTITQRQYLAMQDEGMRAVAAQVQPMIDSILAFHQAQLDGLTELQAQMADALNRTKITKELKKEND